MFEGTHDFGDYRDSHKDFRGHLTPSPFCIEETYPSPKQTTETETQTSKMPGEGKPFCRPKPLSSDTDLLGGKCLVASAVAGSIIELSKKNEKVLSPENKLASSENLKWWQDGNGLAKNTKNAAGLEKALAEAEANNKTISESLEKSFKRLTETENGIKNLTEGLEKKLAANPLGPNTKAIFEAHKKFATSDLQVNGRKDIKAPEIRERIGTLEEVMANPDPKTGKIFVKDSVSANHAKDFRISMHTYDESVRCGRTADLGHLVDAQLHRKSITEIAKAGLKAGPMNAADFHLTNDQLKALSVLETDSTAAIGTIGNAADLSNRSKAFLQGSAEADLLINFHNAKTEHNLLQGQLAETEQAISRLSSEIQLSKTSSGPLVAESASSILNPAGTGNKIFCGAFKGLAIGLGTAAAGHAFDEAMNKQLGIACAEQNPIHIMSDSALLPTIAQAPLPIPAKIAMAAGAFALSRMDIIATALGGKQKA